MTREIRPRAPQIPAELRRLRDEEHLRLLSVFHLIVGGLAALGLPFLFIHFLIMFTVIANLQVWGWPEHAPPPETYHMLFWIYPVLGLFLATGAAINLLSGWFLLQKRHHLFSLVVAGLDCLEVPWGTVLGVFTILVLTRPSVRRMYEASPHA